MIPIIKRLRRSPVKINNWERGEQVWSGVDPKTDTNAARCRKELICLALCEAWRIH
jgi:hypothetical protein